ncbi:hypothetical protein D9756_009896 [Leucocoprinus leucothites]|uniref:Uncharacterized protein n=1 Tax=Leucocoprinus leucothites TaxID=201217 RepID=A0A8H5CUH8_9AGAR|nr:hypothetical protein D9756_009896 [Leucoagaricus leucothites]
MEDHSCHNTLMHYGLHKLRNVTQDANYLFKCVQGWTSQGFRPHAISAQNEPLNSNPTYPTSKLTASQEGQIGTRLRSLLNSNGFSDVEIVGYDHNWSAASSYPIQLMQDAGDAFYGVSFHCYAVSTESLDSKSIDFLVLGKRRLTKFGLGR